jgi:hypothetical protein
MGAVQSALSTSRAPQVEPEFEVEEAGRVGVLDGGDVMAATLFAW